MYSLKKAPIAPGIGQAQAMSINAFARYARPIEWAMSTGAHGDRLTFAGARTAAEDVVVLTLIHRCKEGIDDDVVFSPGFSIDGHARLESTSEHWVIIAAGNCVRVGTETGITANVQNGVHQ